MWGIVTDLDLVSAASSGDLNDRTAGGSAATPVVVVSGRDSLDRAVEPLKDHGTSHLVVVEPDTMQPVGVLSLSTSQPRSPESRSTLDPARRRR